MASLSEVRGSGVRHTLPFVMPFSGLWLVVTVAAMMVFGITSYLAASSSPLLDDAARGRVAIVLAVQTLVLILAAIGLAVFTTHRLAGPYVAMIRAFEAVKNGNLERPLRFRSSDVHLREVETSFEAMLAALRERIAKRDTASGA
jgi:nitrogen fixation/metabolism regulation signal transduction histidine kinase